MRRIGILEVKLLVELIILSYDRKLVIVLVDFVEGGEDVFDDVEGEGEGGGEDVLLVLFEDGEMDVGIVVEEKMVLVLYVLMNVVLL